jgi:hypothetical protein
MMSFSYSRLSWATVGWWRCWSVYCSFCLPWQLPRLAVSLHVVVSPPLHGGPIFVLPHIQSYICWLMGQRWFSQCPTFTHIYISFTCALFVNERFVPCVGQVLILDLYGDKKSSKERRKKEWRGFLLGRWSIWLSDGVEWSVETLIQTQRRSPTLADQKIIAAGDPHDVSTCQLSTPLGFVYGRTHALKLVLAAWRQTGN